MDEREKTDEEREKTDEERDETRNAGREARSQLNRSLIGALLGGGSEDLGALLGITPPDPMEEAREDLRAALRGDTKALPFEVVTVIVTKETGEEMLVTSSQREASLKTMESLETYLEAVVRPVLGPDQRATVRVHHFTPEFLKEHATVAFDHHDLPAHITTMRAEAERRVCVRKYCKCLDCEVEDCDDRITEPPEGYVPA